jgi:hypothetical protein
MDSILAACARTPCALVCGPCESFVAKMRTLLKPSSNILMVRKMATFQPKREVWLIDPWPRLPCRTWRRHVATAALFTLESSIGQRRGQS